jgi:hypothetical protein
MNTIFPIKLRVKGVIVDLIATIAHSPYCGWKIHKLTYRGMIAGVAIYYTPSLLNEKQEESANAQIEYQLEQEQR